MPKDHTLQLVIVVKVCPWFLPVTVFKPNERLLLLLLLLLSVQHRPFDPYELIPFPFIHISLKRAMIH